jgi:RNA polymerase I-specific transcription initiation factor RRN3
MDPGSENGASGFGDICQTLHQNVQTVGTRDRSDYGVILKELTCPDISDGHLQQWLRELKGCTSYVGKGCEDLVGTILELDWFHKDDQFVQDYIDYITSLVSGNAVFLSPCIRNMIILMKPKTVQDTDLKLVFRRAHQALCCILNLAPGGLHVVQEIIQELFPYRGKDAFILDCYVMNLFQLLDYAESLRPFVLELIVTNLIQIDTEILKQGRDCVSDDEEDSEEEDELPQFEMEVNGDNDISELTPYSWPDPIAVASDLCSKVDVLMTRLLAYCNCCCHLGGVFSKHDASYLFRILLEIFTKCILPTYGSFHPQFLCFYVCSLHKTFYEGFLHQLCTTVS